MEKEQAVTEQIVAQQAKKVPLSGWIALFVLIILLSGVFQKSTTFLRAFDFANLSGTFGTIAVTDVVKADSSGKLTLADKAKTNKYTFQGRGGSGAREGVIVALTLMPLVVFAFGLIKACENLGAMVAAEKLFRYILEPLYGIPGICGIAYVATFTSSDLGALMTRQLTEDGSMTDDQRTIFVAYQYPATAVIGNTISTQAALLPYLVVSTGLVIVVLWVCKTLGANLVRLLIMLEHKRQGKKEA